MSKRTKCNLAAVLPPTSSGTQASKVLEMSKTQWADLKQVFADYGMTSPRWLMTQTKLTRPRRKILSELLHESGVDSEWCGHVADDSSWSTNLHKLFHTLEASK